MRVELERGMEWVEPSPEASARSLKQAREWLKRAKDSNILGYRDLATLASFVSMLHAARAILFRDGLREKEDRSMIEYLKGSYPELREHANSLDQYGRLVLAVRRDPSVSIGRKDARGAMDSADGLIKSVERMLSK